MEIKTSYSILRETTDRIIDLTCKMSGLDRNEISINSAINNDLGIDGDDWIDLQAALQEKEGILLEGLEFYNYFQDEAQIADAGLIHFFNVFFQLIWWMISFKWLKMKFADFYEPIRVSKDILTIGDLITSKFESRFVKRSERKFVL
jgi:hypothetical protein